MPKVENSQLQTDVTAEPWRNEKLQNFTASVNIISNKPDN
jgi:hypothetical protein